MVKILIVDTFSADAMEQMRAAGHTVIYDTKAKAALLLEKITAEKPEVLVVRSTKVEASHISAGVPELKVIVRAGSGVDTIDCANAKAQGVKVCNTPGKNSVAVAELVLALILAIDRRIVENVVQFRAGQWNKEAFSECRGLKGRTLGIVGFGNIGREIAQRARAFDMQIVVHDPFVSAEVLAPYNARQLPLLELAAASDIVSVNVVGGASTKQMINEAFFNAMRPGAYFINTSRSSVVNEPALVKAVHEKGIWAGLDVMDNEPQIKKGPFQHPFSAEEHILCTHHIGASTKQAEDAIGEEALRVVMTYATSGQILNAVN